MENASKALVIAGAILISILIIGLGVFIYNGAASTVSKANLNSQEAQAQNQQFEAYFGAKKSAAEVKQLCSLVRSNNITGETGGESKYIAIDFKGQATLPNAVSSSVVAGKTYNVSVVNDNASDQAPNKENPSTKQLVPDLSDNAAYYKSGFIRVITITESSSTTPSTT